MKLKEKTRMTMIKAIDTKYKGYLFRSRLEARWAVYFDAMGIEWEYEREGYELPSGWYLPDFWLPTLKCWVEIKPVQPTERELILCKELSGDDDSDPVMIFYGLPGEHYGRVYYGFPGEHPWIWQSLESINSWIPNDDLALGEQVPNNLKYSIAVEAARSARFEHLK